MDFKSFEGEPGVQVLDRDVLFEGGWGWTFPPVPAQWEVARHGYTVRIRTRAIENSVLRISAIDDRGEELEIFAGGERWYPLPGEERVEVAFDVLRQGELLARDRVTYDVRSRALACAADLP